MTVRRTGAPTEHRDVDRDELMSLLHELKVPLTDDELKRLISRLDELNARACDAPPSPR